MNAARVIYRTRQLWLALNAAPTEAELEQVHKTLGPALMAVFLKMQPGEQAHSLRLLRGLLQLGESHPDLLAAALLHDAGKSRCPLHLWERVLIVLGKAIFPGKTRRWGQGQPHGWRRAFVVAEQHPAWGAEMAERAGASPLAVALIRRHQEPLVLTPETVEDCLLQCLQVMDEES